MEMRLNELKPAEGSVKKKVRLGRGIGSGLGKTAGRGTKGQKARRQIHPMFEGGQTPIHRRLPVKRGFRNPNKVEYAPVNLALLEKSFESGAEVNPENLLAKGLVPKKSEKVKVLGFGDITKKLKISAHAFSKSAAEKIQKAGGEANKL